jgi:DNA polymerase-3 subunit beta
MPITGHLLLSATDDHITITTTNLETTVIAQCPASISEAGTVTLPGKKLYEVLKELSGEEIRLSHNAKTLATTLE